MAPEGDMTLPCFSMVVRSVESTLSKPSNVVIEGSVGGRSQVVSANCVELLQGEAPGDDRNRYTKAGSRLPRQIRDQRSRSFRAGSGREHQYRDARLLRDQGQ